MKPVAAFTCTDYLTPAATRRQSGLMLLLVAACFVMTGGAHTARAHRLTVQDVCANSQQNAHALGNGEILNRKLRGGESHIYQISLARGQYLRVVVEQQGIDVAVQLCGTDGGALARVDNPNGLLGPESMSFVASLSGSYRIEVSADKTMPAGAYELKVEGPREPNPPDVRRVEAERAYDAAQKLRQAGTADSLGRALEKYEAARQSWHELGDARGEGYALIGMGRTHRARGKLSEALDQLARALARFREANDAAGQAFVLNEVGAVHRTIGDPLDALESYRLALDLRNGIGDLWGQAQLHSNIGLMYSNAGQQHQAIEHYGRALPLWRAAGDRYNEANTLNNVAAAYADVGELSFALDNFQQVLKFCREHGDSRLEAYVLNSIGRIYDSWGEAQAALGYYDDALAILRRLENTAGEALVLDNMGMVHAGLGDTQRALEYFNKALPIRRLRNEPRGLAVTLTNIGYAYTLQGKHLEALKHLDLALPLSKATRNKPFEAYGLLQMGMLYFSLREPRKALEYYRQALDIQNELKDRRGQAITLDKIGQANAELGELSKALDDYRQALKHWLAVGDKQGQAITLYGIARVERDRINLREAAERVEEAIGIVESLRTKLTSHQLRLTYFAEKQDFYALDMDVRMRLYEQSHAEADVEAALSASERARARNLLDLLEEPSADIRSRAAPQLAEKSRQLEQEINPLAQSLLSLRGQNRTEDAAAVENRLGKLINEFDDIQAKIRSKSALYAELEQLQPLDARAIRQLLDPDTLLLEYALGDERSYVWMVTQTKIESHTLPGRAQIEKAAWQLRETLTAYEGPKRGESTLKYLARRKTLAEELRRLASTLSRALLEPVASRLEGKRLIIVADGALQYIPFEMLPVSQATGRGQTPPDSSPDSQLISNHEVIYQPSASVLASLRGTPRRRGQKAVAILADPVFDERDERVRVAAGGRKIGATSQPWLGDLNRSLRDIGDTGAGADFKLERLHHSGEEADVIAAAAPRGSVMKATDFNASRATATSQALKQYNIVHFATHGIVNDEHPELSGLILSMVNEKGEPQDGYLRLRDIYNLELPVDLVVLSACRTGVGKQVRGEGLISLTRGFMHAGATKVVASLWKVDDEATAELMRLFYRNMLVRKMPAAAALRRAKLQLMTAREQWRAPYYWAGFVIQGDWK